METQGETSAIQLFATYRGREVLDVTDSSYIAYSSSNPAVATVNTSGEVTAVAAGDASIVATYTLGSQSYPLIIPVNVQHPKLTIAPSSLAFAPQAIGTTGSSQLVTLTNVASYPVKIFSVTSPPAFPEKDDCIDSSPLGPNDSCTINVTFTPIATGSVAAKVEIAESANIVPIAVLVTGTGAAPEQRAPR